MFKTRVQFRYIALSLLLVSSVGAILFVLLPGYSLLWRELQNTDHTILFAIITFVLMGIVRAVSPFDVNKALTGYAITAAVIVAVAVFTELGQTLTHRESSLNDMLRNISGGLIGLGFYVYVDPYLTTFWKQYDRLIRKGVFMLSSCMLAVS